MHIGEIQRIDSYIQKCTAGKLRFHNSLLFQKRIIQIGSHFSHISNYLFSEEIINYFSGRHISCPDRFRQEKIFFFCHAQNFSCLFLIHCKTLFTEYMLSGIQTHLDMLIVMGVRCRDINEFHFLICQHIFIGSKSMLETMIFCKNFCFLQISGCHSVTFHLRHLVHCLRQCSSNPTCTQYSNFHKSSHPFLFLI